MDISYLGHASFKLKGKDSLVVMDPYSKDVGFAMPSTSADIVTVSHDHSDHNNTSGIKGTARRETPFIVNAPGEYEIAGTSIFGVSSFHDDKNGQERGKNTMFVVHVDGISVAHLGDLGHVLTDRQLEELDGVDVLLCPVGGYYTIDAKKASEVIVAIQPSFVIPMHYRSEKHDSKTFSEVSTLEDFLKTMGVSEPKVADKLSVSPLNLPEETEIVVLTS